MMTQYSEKIDAVIYSKLCEEFTPEDFRQLAEAAQDQAGAESDIDSFDDERDRQPRETRAQKMDRADMLNGRYLGEF